MLVLEFCPIWFAATCLTLMGNEALFVRGLALARVEEVMDERCGVQS